MCEDKRIKKQDRYKIDMLGVLKREGKALTQGKLFSKCTCDTKSTNDRNVAFFLHINAIKDDQKKRIHHYQITPLGEAIYERNSGFNPAPNEDMKLDRNTLEIKLPGMIEDFKRKLRAYRKHDIVMSTHGRNETDQIIAMLEDIEKLELEERKVILRKLLEFINRTSTRQRMKDIGDQEIPIILQFFTEYSGYNDKV